MRQVQKIFLLAWAAGQFALSNPAQLSAQAPARPAPSDAQAPPTESKKAGQPAATTSETSSRRPFDFVDGDRVVLLGDALIQREQKHGYVEPRLLARYPNRKIIFRNLGWGADDPLGQSRESFDWHKPEVDQLAQLLAQVAALKPTVAILGYGMASSSGGEAGLPKFKGHLQRLIEGVQALSKEKPVRFILLSPIRHEHLPPPLPDPAKHNEALALYTKAIQEIADAGQHRFISLFDLLPDGTKTDPPVPLTEDGIHLNPVGYWRLAEIVEMGLGWLPTSWRLGITKDGKLRTGSQFIKVEGLEKRDDFVRFKGTTDFLEISLPPGDDNIIPRLAPPNILQVVGLQPGTYVLKIDGHGVLGLTQREWATPQRISGGPPQQRTEALRQAVIKKNELFSQRWRAQHQSYPFGVRSHEQSQNAREVPMFDPLIEEQEAKIAELVKPVPHTYELVRLEDEEAPTQSRRDAKKK